MIGFKDWFFAEVLDRPPIVKNINQEKAILASRWLDAITHVLSWIQKKIFLGGYLIESPEIVIGDRRNIRFQQPSDRLGEQETLWSAKNHNMHDWLLGHQCPGFDSCQLCNEMDEN